MENTTLIGALNVSFLKFKDKKAICFLRDGKTETEIDYRMLMEDSVKLAAHIHSFGVCRGDRVLLILPKSLFFIVSHLAIQYLGAVSVPLNPGFKEDELRFFIKDSNPVLAVTGDAESITINKVDPVLKQLVVNCDAPYQDLNCIPENPKPPSIVHVDPDDASLIIYTSGTTGLPKGAVLSHRNLVHDASRIMDFWEIAKTDVLCHVLPLYHIHGLCFALHTTLLAGSTAVMLDSFSPELVANLLSPGKHHLLCNVFMAVPVMYEKLIRYLKKNNYKFSGLRLITSGSAPLSPRAFKKIHKLFGIEPVEREGMSETGMNFSNPLTGPRKPGSIGVAMPGVSVRVVDVKTFDDVMPGEVGEIWLKSTGIVSGYWNKPKETAETFMDGWFRTGDLGRYDEDGYYFLTDRLKYIIISGGENISPKEIETTLNRMDGIIDSCVFGLADEIWGEKIVAAVIKKNDYRIDASAVKKYCKAKLHDWKCPKEVIFIEEMPRNAMGKILNKELKRLFTERT